MPPAPAVALLAARREPPLGRCSDGLGAEAREDEGLGPFWLWGREETRAASAPLTAPMAPARGWRWVLRALAVRSNRPRRDP
ncbi:hypothetical protein CHIBA101_0530 [Actinomyces sp. Chiba101]|nr:hypothetical protein CHIBA101_0530 [Actinomyces sp. Chiba101]